MNEPRTVSLDTLHLLAAALLCGERGWPVIPLIPGAKRPTGHPERSCPRTGRCSGGHRTPEQRATTEPDLIQTAWAHHPYNVGIATGPAGLLVVDLDVPKEEEQEGAPDGATSFEALCERHGQPFPDTYQVRTPSGGRHLYFTAPRGVRLKCSVKRIAPNIDTRAWGGYVVAAGCTTPQGAYEVAEAAPVAALPAWLAELLTESAKPAEPPTLARVLDGSKAARTALERECAVIRAAREGGPNGRNATLHRSACKVARFVAWGHIDRRTVEEAIQAAGESTGLPAAECRTTIHSAMEWIVAHATPREVA
ncbi:bifunctional DNA primase/polymerase [Streptomyces sp. SLBN-31]|uniref:bifunctional DNA primase/polymerase n=1 Tax=Streptomyces sp. SLBN-31 TaxID=2768444 RepID=UPI0011522BB3|nr:bifunctional DNA primase/polymerase [Streptomyces sp. SLBN-31]TQJ89308.1 bifunctional DNA primase/polymerase-like protein [Streptomyces sp. SLBN-31]